MKLPAFRWRVLATDLKDVTDERPHIDRLRGRVDVSAAQEELEREIVREIATALGRTAEKVDLALVRLEQARATVVAAHTDDERAAAVARFNTLRAEALRARHELVIHREAVGMRHNDVLETMYPIPSPLR